MTTRPPGPGGSPGPGPAAQGEAAQGQAAAQGAIVATGIEHTYESAGPVIALARTDLVVEPGEFVSLVGPSGSGKTTLLNILAGLLTPTQGQVTITGENPAGSGSPVVGYMTQHDTLLPWRTALKNVAFRSSCPGYRSGTVQPGEGLLDRVGLADFTGHYPHQCPAACGSGSAWPAR